MANETKMAAYTYLIKMAAKTKMAEINGCQKMQKKRWLQFK